MHSKLKFLALSSLIQREKAARYMMLSLFSFVATVMVVRTFLALTGYPQIGSGTLHIAHVLWGGLILYIAAILPLIYLDPRLHTIGAVLSGVGVGLFIDEVGKFITRQYDYFFPAAAPIMYVFFLLVVILLIMIRRPEKVDGRAELVQALEIIREQLYRPLEAAEREHIETDLGRLLATDTDPIYKEMAQHLLDFVHTDTRPVPERQTAWIVRIAGQFESWLTEKRLRLLTVVGLFLLAFLTLKNPLQIWLEGVIPGSPLVLFLHAHAGGQINPLESPALFDMRIGLELLVGLLLLVSVFLLLMGRKGQAFNLAYLCLLVSLAVLDMLLFYFEQFSTALTVGFQFVVLFGVIYYRRKFLKSGV